MDTVRVFFNKAGLFLLSISTVFFVPWLFASVLLSALSTRPPIIDLKYLIIFFGAHPIWHNFETAMNNQHRTLIITCFAGVIISLILASSAKSIHDWSLRKITASLLFSSLLAYGLDGLPGVGAAGWDSSIPTLFTRMLLYTFIGVTFFISMKFLFNCFGFRKPMSEESVSSIHGSFWIIGGLALFLNTMGIILFAGYVLYQTKYFENIEFDFHGKIVDQYGKPVSGANVFGYRSQFPLFLSFGSFDQRTLTSDEEGLFTLRNETGTDIMVSFINQDGYYFKNEMRRFYYKERVSGLDKTSESISTPNNPVVFSGWKVEQPEAKLAYFEKRYVFKPGKQSYLIKLNKHANLKVTILLDPEVPLESRTWDMSIEVLDGGLIESNDLYLFEAPKRGYLNKRTISPSEPLINANTHELKRVFYVQSGGKYGHIELKILAYSYGLNVGLKSWFNLDGTRNLFSQVTYWK